LVVGCNSGGSSGTAVYNIKSRLQKRRQIVATMAAAAAAATSCGGSGGGKSRRTVRVGMQAAGVDVSPAQ